MALFLDHVRSHLLILKISITQVALNLVVYATKENCPSYLKRSKFVS